MVSKVYWVGVEVPEVPMHLDLPFPCVKIWIGRGCLGLGSSAIINVMLVVLSG